MENTEADQEFSDRLGRALRAEMAYRGLTMGDVAKGSGLALASVSRYVRGEREITVNALRAILRFLNVETASFLSRVEDAEVGS